MFFTLPEKIENGGHFWIRRRWSIAMKLPNPDPFQFFYYLLPLAKFDIGIFFRNIRASKMRIFVNFDLDLHFQGYLIQELDGQP